MASDDKDQRSDGETNPFVAFRHLVDKQLDTVFLGAAALSAAFTDLHASAGDGQTDITQLVRKFGDSYERAMNPERRKTELREGGNRAANSLAQKDELDPARPPPQVDRRPNPPFEQLQLAASPPPRRFLTPEESVRWRPDIFYLLFSPSSPLVLEHGLSQSERLQAKWRDAFEELLLLEQGEKLPEEKCVEQDSVGRTGEDWLATLASKGLIQHPLFPRLWSDIEWPAQIFRSLLREPSLPESRTEGGADAGTELDMYEQFLGRPSDRGTTSDETSEGTEKRWHSSSQRSSAFKSSAEPSPDGIVSSLTTIERQVYPDGTVTTKRVLKRRFADGHEENKQTTSTSRSPGLQLEQVEQEPARSEQIPREKSDKQKSWFWSD